MHKLILWLFRNLDNIVEIFSLACAFLIIATTLYWLENIFSATWNWLNFIKPVLDIVLNFTNSIMPLSFNAGGATIDMKYAFGIAIFLVLLMIAKFLTDRIKDCQEAYNELHFKHQLKKEKKFNTQLVKSIEKEQKQISKYAILIQTQIQKKFSHKEISVNIDNLNKEMNDFIKSKTGLQYTVFDGGFLYNFDDFNKVDDILDIMFKILKSNTPLEYSMCVQIGENFEQLKKLADIKHFGKILLCADTLLRYKYNKSHRYGTQSIGIYQKEEGTIEVHEFHEIL